MATKDKPETPPPAPVSDPKPPKKPPRTLGSLSKDIKAMADIDLIMLALDDEEKATVRDWFNRKFGVKSVTIPTTGVLA